MHVKQANETHPCTHSHYIGHILRNKLGNVNKTTIKTYLCVNVTHKIIKFAIGKLENRKQWQYNNTWRVIERSNKIHAYYRTTYIHTHIYTHTRIQNILKNGPLFYMYVDTLTHTKKE